MRMTSFTKLILTFSFVLLMFQGSYCEDEKPAEVFECFECMEEHCANTVNCPSKVCYKGVGKNGSQNVFVEACLSDADIPDCVNEALAKARGKDILGAGIMSNADLMENAAEAVENEEDEDEREDEFRQENINDGLVINDCHTCQTTRCNSGIINRATAPAFFVSLIFVAMFL